ncbi:septum-promoting GTP-binding protein 1-like [Rutidosis leptorrhynchoides]|uniref:septum-promoting GTP-binding protein 1-like n=1 Tax=Rutidosis leptorrhynchoides TaxID=125765 RepID=UPI003A9A1AF3
MSQISRKMWGFHLKRTIIWRITFIKRCARSLWHQFLACWIGKSIKYRQLLKSSSGPIIHTSRRRCSRAERTTMTSSSGEMTSYSGGSDRDHDHDVSDLVALKISLLGDHNIGKTSFLAKYVGKEKNTEELQAPSTDKTLCVRGARISYSIWEVSGDAFYPDEGSSNSIPAACKDSVAILFMFDLTSRRTLNSVINWHQQARIYNQTAIPVMIGSKFDEFVQLPLELQWTIASQARAYAKAINATLFFSSASYNINVNKIFKFVTAKLFDLPWTLERNLTVGEPIIDF